MPNNIVDNIEQCCPNNIVASCFQQLLIFGRVAVVVTMVVTRYSNTATTRLEIMGCNRWLKIGYNNVLGQHCSWLSTKFILDVNKIYP